ncbi:hypothetical protein GW12_25550 [Acinetobacter sp. HR7]|nr:hypothetical protein GW12_25550 [Acinetobacter sp. HR7]
MSYVQNETLPICEDFQIELTKNSDLIDVLKGGMLKDKKHLDESLKRLSKYLKTLGY